MAYVGIQTQISRNNRNSVLLLIAFPALLLGMVYGFLYLISEDKTQVSGMFLQSVPWVLAATGIWFCIAYFANTAIIRSATGARPLERKENPRVYNLVENLCISQGMKVPQIFVIEDDALNAYASGINDRTYAVTLSRGIIQALDDAELEGVIAHELTHIRNRDVRLLIVSIVFVGIFAFLSQFAMRSFFYGGMGRRRRDKDNNGVILVAALVVTAVAYFLSILLRFGISRSREYMADAGAAEMTRNPLALASALRKISGNPYIAAVRHEDVAQLFIDHPQKKEQSFSISSLFATHPPIEKRIRALEQY